MTDNTDKYKEVVAEAVFDYIVRHLNIDRIIGVGSGTTVNAFIRILAKHKTAFGGVVAASKASIALLKEYGVTVYTLNEVAPPIFYVDGADEINPLLQMIKGGGGALMWEKIIANSSKEFICIATENKVVKVLGDYPLPIEVLPMARGSMARRLTTLGGTPKWRHKFKTDNRNIILDVSGLNFSDPIRLEQELNQIPGALCNGVFAVRHANRALIAGTDGVRTVFPSKPTPFPQAELF